MAKSKQTGGTELSLPVPSVKTARPRQWFSIVSVYLLIVLYATCYQLQRPVEPFLVDKLAEGMGKEESARAYSQLQAFAGLLQWGGSLAIGYVLDRFGVRVGFVLNFAACSLSYWLLSRADSMAMLWLSKLPLVAMSGYMCAQAALSKLTDSGEERLPALGRLTTSYTIGATIGPYVGGLLGSSGDYYLGARYAIGGSLLCTALVLVMPLSPGRRDATKPAPSIEPVAASWPARVRAVVTATGLFLFVKASTSVANSMMRSSQPLILKNDLGCDEAMMGKVMSAQYAFGGFANAVLLGPIAVLMGGSVRAVVRNCVITMAVGYLAEGVIFSPQAGLLENLEGGLRQYIYFGITMTLALFQYSLGTSITARNTEVVEKSMQGTLLGLEHSIFAIAYTLGPVVGSACLRVGGIGMLAAACGAIFALVYVLMLFCGGESVESPQAHAAKKMQ